MNHQNVYKLTENGKYVPFGVGFETYLPDGIWYVRHGNSSYHTTNVNYLKSIVRKGSTKKFSIKEICSIEDVVDYVIQSRELHDLLNDSHSICDIVRMAVTKAVEFSELNKFSDAKGIMDLNKIIEDYG